MRLKRPLSLLPCRILATCDRVRKERTTRTGTAKEGGRSLLTFSEPGPIPPLFSRPSRSVRPLFCPAPADKVVVVPRHSSPWPGRDRPVAAKGRGPRSLAPLLPPVPVRPSAFLSGPGGQGRRRPVTRSRRGGRADRPAAVLTLPRSRSPRSGERVRSSFIWSSSARHRDVRPRVTNPPSRSSIIWSRSAPSRSRSASSSVRPPIWLGVRGWRTRTRSSSSCVALTSRRTRRRSRRSPYPPPVEIAP
jgi:hypothetical protein